MAITIEQLDTVKDLGFPEPPALPGFSEKSAPAVYLVGLTPKEIEIGQKLRGATVPGKIYFMVANSGIIFELRPASQESYGIELRSPDNNEILPSVAVTRRETMKTPVGDIDYTVVAETLPVREGNIVALGFVEKDVDNNGVFRVQSVLRRRRGHLGEEMPEEPSVLPLGSAPLLV